MAKSVINGEIWLGIGCLSFNALRGCPPPLLVKNHYPRESIVQESGGGEGFLLLLAMALPLHTKN